jgi:small subunit ribosomal protein S8
MTQTYLLSDTLTRIRNAQLVGARFVMVIYSQLVDNLLDILLEEGYIIKKTMYEERKGVHKIRVFLKYSTKLRIPAISEIFTVSRPGKRVYKKLKSIEVMKGGLGIAILSTSHGVITDHQARSLKVGGEILCQVF